MTSKWCAPSPSEDSKWQWGARWNVRPELGAMPRLCSNSGSCHASVIEVWFSQAGVLAESDCGVVENFKTPHTGTTGCDRLAAPAGGREDIRTGQLLHGTGSARTRCLTAPCMRVVPVLSRKQPSWCQCGQRSAIVLQQRGANVDGRMFSDPCTMPQTRQHVHRSDCIAVGQQNIHAERLSARAQSCPAQRSL